MKLVDKELSKFENWYYEPENPPSLTGEVKDPWLRDLINKSSKELYGKPVYNDAPKSAQK